MAMTFADLIATESPVVSSVIEMQMSSIDGSVVKSPLCATKNMRHFSAFALAAEFATALQKRPTGLIATKLARHFRRGRRCRLRITSGGSQLPRWR